MAKQSDPRKIKTQLREQLEILLGSALGKDIDLNDYTKELDFFLGSLNGGFSSETIEDTKNDSDNNNEISLDGKRHPKNILNNLDGKRWMWFTKTVIRTSYPSILAHELRKKQGGNKPPQLMEHLIEFFTKPNEMVLDPFAGAGGTLLGAYLCGRRAIGIEINPNSRKIYLAVCKKEHLKPFPIHLGDCRKVLDGISSDSIDFIATDPPYSIRLEHTMSGEKANANYGRQNRKSGYVQYSNNKDDLSNLGSFEEFYKAMKVVGEKLLRVIKIGGYAAVIIRDAYQDGQYQLAAYRIAQDWQDVGWKIKGDKIWYATGSRMRPYGYPFRYVPNIVHQHILILQKDLVKV
jgi:DNA modification methylase